MDYLLTYADRGFSGNPAEAGADRTYSLDVLPQEYPTWGTGDYRNAALLIQDVYKRQASVYCHIVCADLYSDVLL